MSAHAQVAALSGMRRSTQTSDPRSKSGATLRPGAYPAPERVPDRWNGKEYPFK